MKETKKLDIRLTWPERSANFAQGNGTVRKEILCLSGVDSDQTDEQMTGSP